MKKTRMVALLICISILASALVALAQETTTEEYIKSPATANATVIAPQASYVTAPYTGTLLPFSWNVGDAVIQGDALFEMDSIKVYAPTSGVLRAMFAEEGVAAEGIVSRYGALCVIEPLQPYYLDASTSDAYNSSKNKFIRAGQILYLKKDNEKGEGRVTSVSQDKYIVEILDGDYHMEDTVKCYQESGYANDSVTGTGKVRRYDDTTVTAAGRVLTIHKQEGDRVAEGDLLFELIDEGSMPGSSRDITAPDQGVVSALHVAPGSQVYQGQLLCEIINLNELELSVEVDEVDLSNLTIGNTLPFVLDAFGDREFQGTITEIRPLGTNHQNAAYFDVRVSLPQEAGILPGMNATVTVSP